MTRMLLFICLTIALMVGFTAAVQAYCARYRVHGRRRCEDSGKWSYLKIPADYRPKSGKQYRVIRSHRAWSMI